MTDYSSVVIAAVLALGSLAALAAGYALRGPKGVSGVATALLLAVLLAVGLTVAVGFTWDACHQRLARCAAPTDKTVWYAALFPLFQLPVNWLLMLVFRTR